MNAWIETADGRTVAVESNCHFGRSPVNEVQLDSPGVSRRHAHIHAQRTDGQLEYWLADLGSTNGTLLNGKRITIPTRLKSGDGIRIGEHELIFKLAFDPLHPRIEVEIAPTVPVRANQRAWFLMIDIKGYTALATNVPTATLAPQVGTWLRQSRDIIETNHGIVDKLLGDAVLAYWVDGDKAPAAVAQAIRELTAVQQTRNPDFRIVVHYGVATIFGAGGGADNLSGADIIYVFRMEKVCAKLRHDTIVSAAAAKALPPEIRCESVGSHPLDGFPGEHPFYKLSAI